VTAIHPVRRKISARELGLRYGKDPSTIRRVFAEPRAEYEGRARERREQILDLEAQGLGVRAIARELGVSPGLVSIRLKEARQAVAA